MPTKSEYRQYISSAVWIARRKKFLEDFLCDCVRCGLPRWLMIVAYDQDVHVHHLNYQRSNGTERDEDLAPLCRRCHEIATFGTSSLHAPRCVPCETCGKQCWDLADRLCDGCRSGGSELVQTLQEKLELTSLHYEMKLAELCQFPREREDSEPEQVTVYGEPVTYCGICRSTGKCSC